MTILKPSYWFMLCNDQLLLQETEGKYAIPYGTELPIKDVDAATHEFIAADGTLCGTVSIPEHTVLPDGLIWVNLRSSYEYISYQEFTLAGKAREILHWDKNSRFCPSCGTRTIQILPTAKQCPTCNQEFYPIPITAILALVRKEDSVLLVRALNFRGPFHGLVAGFLEPGETLEECVRREVLEETGLHISNISYFGNQPWPFPIGLMVGFIADYESGDICIQKEELISAAFFKRNELPELPGKFSLARKMIDWWIDNPE